jgi:hypothetical protein
MEVQCRPYNLEHDPERSGLCTKGQSGLAPRSLYRPELGNNAWKFHPLFCEGSEQALAMERVQIVPYQGRATCTDTNAVLQPLFFDSLHCSAIIVASPMSTSQTSAGCADKMELC